uniref:CSON007412 protein n=1 Tax=Culicoides sonorensis TaxID=179676 RepID=A0A336JYE8_CULSO
MDTQNSETNSIEGCNSVLKNNRGNLYNDDSLGPLPPNWERAQTENGEVYFIDHNTGSSSWLDPRLSKFQKKSLEDCGDDELPFGWDIVFDPQYGTYYIDHVNRKTQYENPVLQAKRMSEKERQKGNNIRNNFTNDPSQLIGERIVTNIVKSSKGFGFTIIGGDNSNCEFLQIKNILPSGPAWNDGKLKTGDVLVNVNFICVLGFSHHEMINIFQSIPPDGYAIIEVCRGYPLPPDDPKNTEIITISAVDGQQVNPNILDYNMPEILHFKIIKSENGFGFTIADSFQGQKVKKILDSDTCQHVLVGDILISINGIDVKAMSHNQVVDVLKDCPKNAETSIKVLRSKSSSRYRKYNDMFNNSSNTFNFLNRSKTPTADLYSTEPKTILPIRPKTPLVDTRSRFIAPSNEINVTELEASVHMDINKNSNFRVYKSEQKFLDNVSMTDDISNLTNKLNKWNIESNIYENKSETSKETKQYLENVPESIYSISSNNYAASISNHCVENDYPHENCFCYECQDFNERKQVHNQSNYYSLPPQMNDNVGKRLNEFINDRRFNNMHEGQNLPSNHWEWHQKETSKNDEQVLEITLERQVSGFGFRIVGGTEEGSPITVGHIVPGGAADLDGRIRTGDEIIFINEISLNQASHQRVVQLMIEAGIQGHVALVVKRRAIHHPYDVYVTRHENEGFGFVIISSSSQIYGSTIGKLIPGSPAERSGDLKIGDLIVAVNGINIIGMSHGEVVNLIKESGLQVQLTIDNPRDHRLLDAQLREKINNNSTINHFPIVC